MGGPHSYSYPGYECGPQPYVRERMAYQMMVLTPVKKDLFVFKCYCGRAWNNKSYLMDHVTSEATRVDVRTDDRTHMDISEPVSS